MKEDHLQSDLSPEESPEGNPAAVPAEGMESDPFKLSNKVQEKPMMSLAVYNVGRQKCTPGYRWGPGIRDHYLIHYISAGRGTYTVLDRTFQLQEGDAFLIYPGMAVSYQADMRRPWSYEWVGFAGTDARPILDMTDFSPESLVLTAPAYGKDLQKHLRRINQAFGNTFRESISMTGELYSLLALLVGGSSRDRTARGRDAALFLRDLRRRCGRLCGGIQEHPVPGLYKADGAFSQRISGQLQDRQGQVPAQALGTDHRRHRGIGRLR